MAATRASLGLECRFAGIRVLVPGECGCRQTRGTIPGIGIVPDGPVPTGLYLSTAKAVPEGVSSPKDWLRRVESERGRLRKLFVRFGEPKQDRRGKSALYFVEGARKPLLNAECREGYVVQGGLCARFIDYRPLRTAKGRSLADKVLDRVWDGVFLEGAG